MELKKDKIITFFDSGPSITELRERDKNKLCFSVNYNMHGDAKFCCNNYTKPYIVNVYPLIKPKIIWITEAMLCKECLLKLSKKYNINFEENYPLHYLKKGWDENTNKQINSLPLIKEFKEFTNEKNNDFFNFLDPEKQIWSCGSFLKGIPFNWLQNFSIEEIIGKNTAKQGKYNGPDFIFWNKLNKKKVGFEVVSYKWNIHNTFKDMDFAKKFALENIYDVANFDKKIEDLKKIISKKLNLKKNYKKTDEFYIGIIVNNALLDYEYYILEIILNKWVIDNKYKVNEVFIL